MPLIPVAKKKKEGKYEFTAYEKLALEILPEEQVRASNHSEHLIDLMIDDEARDASPEHTKRDIYKALEQRDIKRLLAATKNLTVAEKNKVVQGIYHSLLTGQKSNYLIQSKDGRTLLNDNKFYEDAKRLSLLTEAPLDLFDFCIRLDQK